MIRGLAIALALLPQVAAAQDWTTSLRVTGAVADERNDTGSALFVGTAGDGAWNGTELYQSEPAVDDVSCVAAREFEIDHYVGYGEDYILQVLITFARNGDGTWSAISPDIYYDIEDSAGNSASYAGFDGTAKVQSLTCADSIVTVSYSFRGEAITEVAKAPSVQIAGSGSVTLPIYPYSDY